MSKTIPLLLNHDVNQIVGYVEITDEKFEKFLIDATVNKTIDVEANFAFGVCVQIPENVILHASINRKPIY